MKKSKISFVNCSLEDLELNVVELENITHYSYGSIKNAYWSHSLYSQFYDEMGLEEDMFPINENRMKAFLLELSKVYNYETVKGTFLNIRRAHGIISNEKMSQVSATMKNFFKLVQKSYGERIIGTAESTANKRRPLLPENVYKIVDSIDESVIGIRDKSILLVNMILGQRCDSLQFIQLKHLEFVNHDGNISLYITVIKEKSGYLKIPRKRVITQSEKSEYCPVRAMLLWIYVRNAFDNNNSNFDKFLEEKEFKLPQRSLDWPCWCNVSHKQLVNLSPMEAYEIGRSVARNAKITGFADGMITGHSMRKGCATAWIMNVIKKKGTYSREDWHDLEAHIGWDLDSSNTKLYVDQNIKLLRDTTNLITNEKQTDNYIYNPSALKYISPSPISLSLQKSRLPDDIRDAILNKFNEKKDEIGDKKSIKEENQIKKLTSEILAELFKSLDLKEEIDKDRLALQKYNILSQTQQKWIDGLNLPIRKCFKSGFKVPDFTADQKKKFHNLKNVEFRKRKKNKCKLVCSALWKMKPAERVVIYKKSSLKNYICTERPFKLVSTKKNTKKYDNLNLKIETRKKEKLRQLKEKKN